MTQMNPELDNNWYFALANQQYGPVPFQDLRQRLAAGQVTMADMVWHPTMPDWVPASQLPYFSDITAPLQYQNMYPGTYGIIYAGFWLRLAACVIDYIVLYIPSVIIQLPLQFMLRGNIRTTGGGQFPIQMLGYVGASYGLTIAIRWLYYALMESSPKQASLGKMACGIKVTDLDGGRLSFGHASGRYFASLLSNLTIGIGYMMAGWTAQKQALHDTIAKTLVIKK